MAQVVRAVMWRGLTTPSMEYAVLRRDGEDWYLEGTVVTRLADEPAQVRYTVACGGDWRTRRTRLSLDRAAGSRTLVLSVDDAHHWTLDGGPRPDLDACADVDLSVTPATNTLPIRRLKLAVGESTAVTAAWVRFPELVVQPLEQRYTRLDATRYRYESATGFSADLTVDEDGLPTDYPGGWQRV